MLSIPFTLRIRGVSRCTRRCIHTARVCVGGGGDVEMYTHTAHVCVGGEMYTHTARVCMCGEICTPSTCVWCVEGVKCKHSACVVGGGEGRGSSRWVHV